MLPSMRHFLKFIDGYEKWDAHGFNIKVRERNVPFKKLRILTPGQRKEARSA